MRLAVALILATLLSACGGAPTCGGDPCCGDPCCGDPCCGDPCCGDPCCGDPCCGDPCCGDPCCGGGCAPVNPTTSANAAARSFSSPASEAVANPTAAPVDGGQQ